MTDLSNPALPTQRITRKDGLYTLKVWCPWCEENHVHGVSEGHRLAHCANIYDGYSHPNSPLKGYHTDVVSECTAEKNLTFPDKSGGRFFADLTFKQGDLRAYFIKLLFGKRLVKSAQSHVFADKTRLNVEGLWLGGVDWFVTRKGKEITYGIDLLSMLSFLYAISVGIVAVRLLEALTSCTFDAQGKLEIADVVNRAYERTEALKTSALHE